MEATIQSRIDSLENKNKALQKELNDFNHRYDSLEIEYSNAVEKIKTAKSDAKMNPKGVHIYIYICIYIHCVLSFIHKYIHTYIMYVCI